MDNLIRDKRIIKNLVRDEVRRTYYFSYSIDAFTSIFKNSTYLWIYFSFFKYSVLLKILSILCIIKHYNFCKENILYSRETLNYNITNGS